jgi:Bacterial cadherin-like domain/Alpha amylase, catalytic domain
MKNILRLTVCLGGLLLALAIAPRAQAVLANAWHIPDNTADLGFNMRNPEFEVGTNTTVTVYSGEQKYGNSFGGTGVANQTGGWVVYKGASQSSWSSNALGFYLNGSGNIANNQYWLASFNTTNFGTDEVIQYFLYLTFDGVNGVANTYLYGGDGGSTTTASPATAAASPFTIRNRPAWIFHAANRVVIQGTNANTSNVGFWAKVGYQGKDGTVGSRWADNACVYYTTDGSTPAGSHGAGTGTTLAAPMRFDHEENDLSVAGNDMWWTVTVSNLPDFTPINYLIGVWHSANGEEKFADYHAGTNAVVYNFSIGTLGDPVLTVNGVNADYTTEHLFVDEVAGDSVPVTVVFSPGVSNIVEADVYSNLNRRNRATLDANNDGIEDGIVPPDGNLLATGDDNNYYKAYAMTPTGIAGQYSLTLNATNCGAYRLTARYRVSGNPNWLWYSGGGRRDHSIVVTPARARNMTMYEMNPMNIDAQGTNFADRSTFADLYNGPGSRAYDPVTNRFNLQYVRNLGVNWLWLQPVHPIGVLNRQTDPNTGQPYSVGSPYSIKNYFQINPLLGKANTRDGAMQEFTNFVIAAAAAGVNVMLDEPFNHSAWDCELDAAGTNYFATNSQPTDTIANSEARLYSRSGEYDQRASSAATVAQAPDRYDFGKWTDVADFYFGRYAALVPNAAATGNYTSEADWFDYTVGSESGTGSGNGHFDRITQNVWRYFSDCILYWLDKTGCPTNTPLAQTGSRGIGGLRADFGQGLPPQCWEYIINKVRTRKWDFVFMTESLDGGAVTYRSNRHFDVLNENLLFALQSAATASDYRNAYDSRRNSYGQGLVLLNDTSHDEETYSDPYQGLIRFMASSTIDGAPMIFYGEELGVSTYFGFNLYQLNFGKTIPHFMVYNSLQPIFNPANRTYGLDQLWPVYAAVNQARQFSTALRSPNRYYLNQLSSGSPQASIFSVAKYQTANASPNTSDVVLAFTTLDRNNQQSGVFNVNITQNGANLFGIQSNRLYNVKNIAAYTAYDSNRRNYWLWNGGSGGVAGSNVLANGIYVGLNPVPAANSGWTNAPFEAQYLKLYDVTPPPTPGTPGAPATVHGTNATFTWTGVSDPAGGIAGYHLFVGTTPGGSDVFNGTVGGTSNVVTGSIGQTLYAYVKAVNNAGIEGAASGVSAGTALAASHPPVAGTDTYQRGVGTPLHIRIADLLTNDSDPDGNPITFTGLTLLTTNGVTLVTNSTFIFYTNAMNWNDRFNYYISDSQGGSATGLVVIQVVSVASNNTVIGLLAGVPGAGSATLTFAGVPGYQYVVQFATNLLNDQWITLATNTAGTNGLWQVVDPTATNRQRYYRSFLPLQP